MSEHDEQVKIFHWASYCEGRWPEIELLHAIPNGGHRHKRVAVRMKAEGVKPGVPDMFLPVPRGGYHGLYIELKHKKNAATDEQDVWLRKLREQGYCAVVAYEYEGGSAVIEDYLEGRLTRET